MVPAFDPMTLQPLFSHITGNKDELVSSVQSLIRFQTVNPPGNHYLEACDFLAQRLDELGMKTVIHRVPKGEIRDRQSDLAPFPRANVIGRWDIGAARTVHFNAHYDVVPASADWKHGAFVPAVEGDWLYGRGSADMKGSIGSLLHTLAAFRRSDRKPSVNVEVSLTADEETDSAFGAEWVVRNGLVAADWAVVCEGGSGLNIGCGHNGVLWMEVAVIGRSNHGATPERGINAVENMSRLITALEKYQKTLARRTFVGPDGTLRRATINVGGVTATAPGGKINTVPGRVSFTIDRRVLPNEDLRGAERDLLAFLKKTEKKVPGLKTEVRRIGRHRANYLDPAEDLPRLFAGSVGSVRRHRPGFTVSPGFNDAHFFAEAGIPAIGYGPGGQNYHGVDERVSIRELLTTSKVYAHFLAQAGLSA
jgi:succinyl-diaminopimelate desuccinylase